MPDSSHAILGPGYHGAGAWMWSFVLAFLALLAGAIMTYTNPIYFGIGVAALLALAAFVAASVSYPIPTLCFVIICQVLVPVYIRLPLGLPPPLFMLALYIMVTAIAAMMNPTRNKPGQYEHLLAVVVLIYNVALLVTIPGPDATISSYLMLIKTVIIPSSLFFVFLATIRTAQHVERVFKAVNFAAVSCGLLALHEFATKQNVVARWLAPPVSIEEDFFLWLITEVDNEVSFVTGELYRVYSFFTQPLEYSAFMIMVFPFAALSFATARSWSARISYGLATLIIFMGFIVTFSRGPTLALAIVILFLAVFERRVRPYLLAGVTVLLVGIVAFWPLIVDKLGERVTGSENVTLRFSLWQNGMKIFADNPLTGVGYGSYPNVHVQTIRENQIGPMYEYTWPHIERVTTVENVFVTLAAETGMLGLTAFAVLLASAFFVFRRIFTSAPTERSRILALSACAALLSFLLSGMTVANIIGYTISILFFGVYIASLAVLSRDLPQGGPDLRRTNAVSLPVVET